jgi:hypothetical protein
VRGASTQGGRRLICTTDELELVLHVLPAKQPGCVDVLGHILTPDAAAFLPAEVELWQGHVHRFRASAGESGEFQCRDIPQGDYSFLLLGRAERGLLLAPASLVP